MDAIELKILRIKARLRQYEVAARLGITQTKLSEIECGRIQPSPELLERNLGALEGELRAKGRSKRSVAHPGTPTWGHPTGWALWCLSLVLKEISENFEPRPEKREALGQASATYPVTAGTKQDFPDE
jgi:transcriptional regulator with XRE-family HTH domain